MSSATFIMHFPDFDAQEFLREYWQKKPLLIRNPWAEWHNPVEPDELAGLACEEGMESRLVTGGAALTLEHGPLQDDRFSALGTAPWTLLVQAADHHIPAVADLIEPFRFIPNWRIDDVMVSYATDQGGVGAHFDQYDVFLIQGLGRRRWELGDPCNEQTALLPHEDLRLLAEFEPREEWVLEPGDILYVPPGIAHRGTAIGDDCMTYSVGFRAPSRRELIEEWTEDLLGELSEDDRFGDPDLEMQPNPGEIQAQTLARLHQMVAERLNDKDRFARWFGTYATAPKPSAVDWRPEHSIGPEEVSIALRSGAPLVRNPASRFAFVRQESESLLLYVDGEAIECSGEVAVFAQTLCASPLVETTLSIATTQPTRDLIWSLVNRGCIAFEEPED